MSMCLDSLPRSLFAPTFSFTNLLRAMRDELTRFRYHGFSLPHNLQRYPFLSLPRLPRAQVSRCKGSRCTCWGFRQYFLIIKRFCQFIMSILQFIYLFDEYIQIILIRFTINVVLIMMRNQIRYLHSTNLKSS